MAISAARAHEFIHITTGYLHERITKMLKYTGNDPSSDQKGNNVRLSGPRVIPYFTDEPLQKNLSQNMESLKILVSLAQERYCSRLCVFVDEFFRADNLPDHDPGYLASIKAFMLDASRRELRGVYNQVERPLSNSFWSSIEPAGSMYVNNVVADMPANDCEAYARLYLRLTRDIDSTERTMRFRADGHQIWLWKVFTGAYTIAKTQLVAEEASGRSEDGCSTFRTLRLWFSQRIQSWSRRAQVKDWTDAEKALSTVSWPKNSPGAGLSEKLWQEAVWQNRSIQRFDVETLLIH